MKVKPLILSNWLRLIFEGRCFRRLIVLLCAALTVAGCALSEKPEPEQPPPPPPVVKPETPPPPPPAPVTIEPVPTPGGEQQTAKPTPVDASQRGGLPPPPVIRPGTTRVGLLVPLSGKLSGLGNSMLNAAQLAVADLAGPNFELLPYDTSDTTDRAVRAVKAAISDSVSIVLGPLLSPAVQAVTPVAEDSKVPVIAFSSDRKVAEPGVYVMGFAPEAEVERIVSFAAARGYERIAAIVSDDAYGRAVETAMRSTAKANKMAVVTVKTFDPNSTDKDEDMVRAVLGDAAAATPPPPSPDTPQWARDLANPTALAQMAPHAPLPFDCLLISAGGDRLKSIAHTLAANTVDLSAARLLGTGTWDESGLGKEDALVSGWYAAPKPSLRTDFEAHYRQVFGRAPERLATLAYDATALAIVLSQGSSATPFGEAAITDNYGFMGRDGLFRFQVNGIIDRSLAVLQVDKNGVTVIDEPAVTFAVY